MLLKIYKNLYLTIVGWEARTHKLDLLVLLARSKRVLSWTRVKRSALTWLVQQAKRVCSCIREAKYFPMQVPLLYWRCNPLRIVELDWLELFFFI